MNALTYLSSGPLCMAELDTETLRVVQVNMMFEEVVGQMFKISGMEFSMLATEGELHRVKLEQAIKDVIDGKAERSKARNIEMLTLAGMGLPIRRHFDWSVGGASRGKLLLFGDPCTDEDVKQRAKDSELVDFFQNAPIALHWLSGEGIVLWANQRELDVLGYTAEEYIGQPIMNFCPDEEELVLEIFKQLGSGNTIKDVPVRFRAKDGHIVDLLIDSNVKYDEYGNFEHTRCFIRDDTKRKITEARAKLLLDETKRSLVMLDNFMSRSLHHMRTPLHVLQSTIDVLSSSLSKINPLDAKDTKRIVEASGNLLHQASIHIDNAVVLIDDISDLARLDQGGSFKINNEIIVLKDFGKEVLSMLPIPVVTNVEIALELTGGGPTFLTCDSRILKKILRHLLENAVNVTEHGSITLRIGHQENRCVFTIIDSGPGITLNVPAHREDNSLPPIFQRYHQELLPEEILDFEQVTTLRDKIEAGINSHRNVSMGIGLSLTYHLVQALGGNLRYSSTPGRTQFWFSLPQSFEELAPERIILKNPGKRDIHGHNVHHEPGAESTISKASIACNRLKVMDPPSVLVVEDDKTCAKLLCMSLQKVNCSATWAENGLEAVHILKSSVPGMYSLVIMDLRMPVMDGLTATKVIKKELKIDIPVIALTGDAGNDTKSQCEEIGFDEYCNKPMKRAKLLDIIQKYTGYNPAQVDQTFPGQSSDVCQ
jgi:PAS domain S-box-containing protein